MESKKQIYVITAYYNFKDAEVFYTTIKRKATLKMIELETDDSVGMCSYEQFDLF